MKWSPQQEDCLQDFNRWYNNGAEGLVYRIFGYAGTGKTTLAKHLAEGIDGEVLFGAYTGKAAHVLTNKGCPASTIHSMIYHSRDKGKSRLLTLEQDLEAAIQRFVKLGFNAIEIEDKKEIIEYRRLIREETKALSQPFFIRNPESIVHDAALVVIDECSMVDGQMGEDLLSFGTPILVLGDPAQLPPVGGAGYFTENVKPNVMLTEIHRQAQESGIIQLATIFRNGEKPSLGHYAHDCEVIHIDEINADMVMSPDQIIVGKNVTRSSYNRRMRQLLGHATREDYNPYPVAGERLICLRNNHELGLLNGAMFGVHYVGGVLDDKVYLEIIPQDEEEQGMVEVSSHTHYFLGRKKEDLPYWERKEAEEFDYGYAITGHKSQGSQWNDVIVFDESYCFRNDWNRWSYTAATRAAKNLTWVLTR